jgi:hypothetical protein
MRRGFFPGLALAVALVLGACAQQQQAPAPIVPEPIYNKYGDVIGTSTPTECRPAAQPVGTQYPPTLPVCEEICRPGEQPQSTTFGQRICVPIPGDRNDRGRQPDPQRPTNPTFGQ